MNWLLGKLGYVPKREATAMMERYHALVQGELAQIVDKHEMQNAWEQVKQERKQMRVH